MSEENDIRIFYLLKCACLCYFFFPQGTAKAFSGDAIARPLSRKVCTCVGPGTTVIMHNDIFFKKMGDFNCFQIHHDYPNGDFFTCSTRNPT